MIFYATASANQNDLVEMEARQAGSTDVYVTNGGVEFEADLAVAYRFCLWTRTATRVLLALFQDECVTSADELYDSSIQIPWENWVTPENTFAVTETVTDCRWLKNSHFAALRVKDAIVDRIREHFEDKRPNVDRDVPDVTFHIHVDGERVVWYVDFSGKSLHKRGYRKMQTDAILTEYLAAALLYRSDWRKSLDGEDGPEPLLDPFCGSGTICIEAAWMATDTAPGLLNTSKFAFFKLPIHDPDVWEDILDEAAARQEEGRKQQVKIYAWDKDPEALGIAKANAQAAGVVDIIEFARHDVKDLTAGDIPVERGCIVTDPPYGVRLENENIENLYIAMGRQFNSLFAGWRIAILCGDQQLLSYVDMKPNRTNTLFNGGMPCQIAHYYVFTEEERAEMIAKAEQKRRERLAKPLTPGAEMAANRLKKNLAALKPLMEAQNVSSYRIYDADMPEYSAAIDLYENRWISLQEYAAPSSIDPEDAIRRLEELIDATERVTGIDRDMIFVKQRTQQKGLNQYEKLATTNRFFIMRENGLKFMVNFTDYLDTGIFLDHRPVRRMIREMSDGKRFLNLFCYTGTATAYAAAGNALSTVSVDASSTYLDWALKNMQLNGFTGMNHFFYKEDCIEWLFDTYDRFDLIFCDPPTFSNSKSRRTFDVDQDQVKLIRACMMHLEKDGTLIFSNNYRKFQLDERLYEQFAVQDISSETIGDDFKRDEKIHKCFLIRHKKVTPQKAQPEIRTIRKAVLKKPLD
ncbi:MAG: bifunctional 23S rRNA (guanine(2069)-N(7))-methyltransferase RlmK/23S rRNA (guanine(2445)-N(2))-methyltransferase RlmL [Sphaerochaetaceae bacterium]|nr:bifunctional 23S rRNA (guanine(2069)-N(7))-methyltransferase RlmK/23S rRNA (guanine(2445)-N(2))-methyltransferase RlmL [Sphaerochaetaceae bacterium]